MGIHAIQPSFAGGEFAPSLHSRVDLQKYQSGLRKGLNIFIHPHGGASNRPGLKFIAAVKDAARKTRVVPFEFSTEQAYVIEFGHLYCRFYRNGGQILKASPTAWITSHGYVIGDFVEESATTYYCIEAHTSGVFATDLAANKWIAQETFEIPTPYTEDDIFDLKFAQSADVLYVVHPDHAPRELTRTDHDAWTLTDYEFKKGPFMLSNETDTTLKITDTSVAPAWTTSTFYSLEALVVESGIVYRCTIGHTSGVFAADLAAKNWVIALYTLDEDSAALNVEASSPTFEPDHVGSVWIQRVKISGQTTTGFISPAHTGSKIIAGSAWRLFMSGTFQGLTVLEKSVDNGQTWIPIFTTAVNVDTFGDTGEEQCHLRLTRTAAGESYSSDSYGGRSLAQSGAPLATLSSDEFTWRNYFEITAVGSPTSATATAQNVTAAGDVSKDWAEGSWSNLRGFPRAVVFFQNRLNLAATKSEPQTIWMSQIGLYDNFGRSIPLLDSDGISVRVPSQKVNIIQNLIALNEIIALTSADDWEIRSDTGIITPGTVVTRPRGFRGSGKPSPVIVGTRAIVVHPLGSAMRDIFSTDLEGFQGENISIVSSHLFQGFNVVEFAYAQEPDSLIWVVRSDGKLLSLTFMAEQEILAWTRHDTDGEFKSTCTIPGPEYDEAWFVVKRGADRFIEQMQRRLPSTHPHDSFFVDSGLSLDIPKAIESATNASPVVIGSTDHGFSNGDVLDLRLGKKIIKNPNEEDEEIIFKGMGELNNKRVKVKNKTDDTYEITDENDVDIDGTAFSAFDEPGEARKTTTTITGLGHLEGREVVSLANGKVQPPKTVSGGEITLDNPASTVHAGLGYISDLETLNIEMPLRDGTLQGRKIKIDELIVRLLDSRGMRAGPSDGRVLDELTRRSGEPLGDSMDLFTGDALISFQGGYEDFGRVLIRQTLPLPMTVLALIPRFTPGSR